MWVWVKVYAINAVRYLGANLQRQSADEREAKTSTRALFFSSFSLGSSKFLCGAFQYQALPRTQPHVPEKKILLAVTDQIARGTNSRFGSRCRQTFEPSRCCYSRERERDGLSPPKPR